MGTWLVDATEDPREALAAADEFLTGNPVQHNLALTLLRDRVEVPLAGRYWWAHDAERVVGFVMQSPRTFKATVTPIEASAVPRLVDRVAADMPGLPGVIGDATTAALFAGCWTDRVRVAVGPDDGGRLYRVNEVRATPTVSGRLRPADANNRDVLVRWLDDFQEESGDGPGDSADAIDRRLQEERLWVWDDGGAVSMAMATRPIARVVRVGWVYTPPERRTRGYATAIVATLTAQTLATEARTCILYTQLGNPTSNAIYRRIGYEPIAEILSYRFRSR